jgi:hypothetical protein
MKAPRFEALAKSYEGKADVYFVFSDEAHPRAASSARLNAFADQVAKMDRDGDGRVTLAEYEGPRFMFDAFDLDHDGVVLAHELLAARRIDDFKDFDAPRTYAERVQVVARFRREVPGRIRVLVDELDGRTARAFGGLPNMAFVVDGAGVVRLKQAWADAHGVDATLAALTGRMGTLATLGPAKLDWAPVARERAQALKTKRPLLIELTSPGCGACKQMESTLADAQVKAALGRFERARVGVENDAGWALFEALGLHATPGFVIVNGDGSLRARLEGAQPPATFLRFLGP